MGNMRWAVRGWGALLSLVFLLPAPLYAQGGGQSEALEEVVVTAQRREESLQDVPASVSALSAETLEQQNIFNVVDLDNAIPSMVISQNTGTASTARIYLRGIGEDESRATVEPAVSLYVDGVYLGRSTGGLVEMLDLERVEVLRGPQGTLYGRNANAGAIKLVSRKPDIGGDMEFSVEPFVGSEDLRGLKFKGNIPLAENAALRVSAIHKTREGFFANKTNGDNLGGIDVRGLRLYGYREEDNWDAALIVESVRNDSDARPANVSEDSGRGARTDLNGGVYSIEGMARVVADGTTVANPTAGSPYTAAVEQDAASLIVNVQLNPYYRFSSISSYRTLEDELNSWILGSYIQQTDQSQFSQEFQITSDLEGPFNYVMGAFLFNEDIDLPFTYFASGRLQVDTEAVAVYAQGNYDVVPGSRLTMGVRHTQEEKEFSGFFSGFGTPRMRDDKRDWDNTSVKLAFSQDVMENMMVFASYATGFRSGAWSPDAFAGTAVFLPVEDETVRTVEIGLRSEWFDNRLRANATVFFSDYEDLQISGTTPAGFTRFNAGDVEINGLELELKALLTPSLELGLVASTLDAEYKTLSYDAAASTLNIAGNPDTWITPDGRGALFLSSEEITAWQAATDDEKARLLPGIQDRAIEMVESFDLKGVPEFSATLSLVYNTALANGWQIQWSGDIAYEDDAYSLGGTYLSHSEIGEKTLLNMRLSVVDAQDKWEVAAWGKNLSDELYYPASIYQGATDTNYVFASDPRTFGVDLKFLF